MDDDRFWAIVAAAGKAAGDDVAYRVAGLEQVLMAQHAEEVLEFQAKYDELMEHAHRWDLRGAALVLNGHCSDADFEHFRDWLISAGEAVYDAALADPDSLAALRQHEDFMLEPFGRVAAEVYEQMTDSPMPRRKNVASESPSGRRWEEAQLASMLPRLAALRGR